MDAHTINKDIEIPFLDKNSLNIFSLEFKKNNLENLYRQQRTIEIVRRSRFSVALSFFMYLTHTLLVYFFESAAVLNVWQIHILIIALYFSVYAITYSKYMTVYPQVLVMAGAVFITAICMFAIYNGYENKDQYCYAGVSLCITWIIFMAGLRFINAIIVICIILVFHQFNGQF